MIDKYKLVEDLKNGVVTVVFEKKNGEERTMRSTLSDMYVPQVLTEYVDRTKDEIPQLKSDNVMTVWDIDSGGWRSFRLDTVKQLIKE